MKIIATSDTHFYVNQKKNPIPDGDVFIHAGDFLYKGIESEYEHAFLPWITKLNHEIIIITPGNHDRYVELYPGRCFQDLRQANVWCGWDDDNGSYRSFDKPRSTDPKAFLPNGMSVLCVPYVTNLKHWAFNRTEAWIEEYLMRHGYYDIVVAHSPPYGLLDNKKSHYGTYALLKYIDKFSPKIVICGHVHESYGHMKYKKTDIFNVCMCDRNYNQVNKPIIIEV